MPSPAPIYMLPLLYPSSLFFSPQTPDARLRAAFETPAKFRPGLRLGDDAVLSSFSRTCFFRRSSTSILFTS